jgi:hypothetical protein
MLIELLLKVRDSISMYSLFKNYNYLKHKKMKTQFTAIMAAALLFGSAMLTVSGQGIENNTAFNSTSAVLSISSSSKAKSDPAEKTSAINRKALKDFTKHYKNATNQTWYKLADGNSIARFTSGGVDTKVFYNARGQWLYDLFTYTEDKLPVEIRNMVKSTYFNFDIFLCQELKSQDGHVYLIKMQNEKTVKTAKIIEGEMSLIEEFSKG